MKNNILKKIYTATLRASWSSSRFPFYTRTARSTNHPPHRRREMMKSLIHRTSAKLSSALSFLGNKILPRRSSMVAPATELTAPGADPANMTLDMSDRAALSMSGTASSSGQHPEPSNHLSGELRIDMTDADAGAGAGLDYELGSTQSSVGTVEQDEELDLELQLGSNENSDAPVPGLRAYLSFRAPLQAPYILFGLRTNITLSLINIKLIHDMKLPGSSPTLPEGVLAAAAGIGLLASAPAIYLQVKNRRSVPAKVLSQISVISLVSSVLVNLSTRFGLVQFGLVNIVATSGLFLFIVGMVIHVGSSTAVY